MVELTDPQEAVKKIIATVGKNIIIAAPSGAGKPNHFLNAIYQVAKSDPSINLTILTALTLQVPKAKSDLERRFLDPFTKRVFGNYPDLDYETDRVNESLPRNIQVLEFYYLAGKYVNQSNAQRNYLSSNYTHVVRDLCSRGVNVICQQVARDQVDGQSTLSLSCNSDLTLDLVEMMSQQGKPLMKVAQVNQDLPFMYGESIVGEEFFDMIINNQDMYFQTFAPPKMSVSPADHMIGLHASTLVKDDGEIQIGIGSLGDALVHALCLRQNDNSTYKKCLEQVGIDGEAFPVIDSDGGSSIFKIGLFAATEMLVDSFAELYKAKILKKKVFDSVILQRLLNLKLITEEFSDDILDVLRREKAIGSVLSEKDFVFLKEFGIFKSTVKFKDEEIVLPDGSHVSADLANTVNYEKIKNNALGKNLRNGAVAHGGFFLGPKSFYNFLKQLPVKERKLFRMKRISQINQLYGHEEIDRLQRTNGRFINTCMKVSLNGAACSDALADGNQVSGVGGQYNFVAMAHELPDARSILQLRSTRIGKKGELESNIVFNYGNCTIPRHLRDIVITEYGIADLRSKTDEEVAIELIQIADSRFQSGLIRKAIAANKLRSDFNLSPRFKNNYPKRYTDFIKNMNQYQLFTPFPFGTDLTADEIKLGRALKGLKALQKDKIKFLKFIMKSLLVGEESEELSRLLKRMDLENPKNFKETLYKKLILKSLESRR